MSLHAQLGDKVTVLTNTVYTTLLLNFRKLIRAKNKERTNEPLTSDVSGVN